MLLLKEELREPFAALLFSAFMCKTGAENSALIIGKILIFTIHFSIRIKIFLFNLKMLAI
jgi:hypothetical protein